MAYIVRLPGLGMQQDRARLVAWQVDPGERVEEGDLLAQVETEKATIDVEADEDGVLRRVYADVGETRTPNEPLAIVAGPDEDISSLEARVDETAVDRANGDGDQRKHESDRRKQESDQQGAESERQETERGTQDATSDRRISPRARKRADELGVDLDSLGDVEDPVTAEDIERVAESGPSAASAERGEQSTPDRVTPRARKRADELGVDLAGIEGTGPGGAVTEADVEAAAESGAGSDADMETGTGDGMPTVREEHPLSEMRRTIATRLGESYREAVHVTIERGADAEPLLAAVEACEQELDADVSMLDLLLVALSRALEEHPEFNATFKDETLSIYEEHNVGVAVDMERGLVTPVLENVGGKSLAEVATERRRLTERVLADEFTVEDLQGGTITVTNLGPFGVESFDPIINPPQVAILGVNALRERPVRGERGLSRFRRELPLSLSFDHRAVDGADAARFLATLVDHLEDPGALLPAGVERDGGEPLGDGEGEEMPGRSLTAQVEDDLAGTVRGGSFEWSFDEPVELGGGGGAPSPVDYFLGSLAACLAASVRFQAEKRGLAVEAVRVDVDGEPEHGDLESVAVTVGLQSDAEEEQLAEIVELGERGCHVAATLREDLPVEVSWMRL